MNDGARRERNRRSFRLESLEDRNLLSTVRPLGASAFRGPVLPGPLHPVSVIHGQVSGTAATDGLYGGTPRGYASASGNGTFRQFGGVLFGTTFRATPASTSTTTGNLTVDNGQALFITSKGGAQIRAAFSGLATTARSGVDDWTFHGTIVSGTGRFQDATGTFDATGTANLGPAGRFTMSVTIHLNPPR